MIRRSLNRRPPREGGFAYVAAVLLLVVVAGLAAAIVRLNAAQQNTSNDALLVARASQAARAGTEWMIYRLARAGSAGCAGVTLDLRNATGFRVGVKCTAVAPTDASTPGNQYAEGYDPDDPSAPAKELVFKVESVACNGATATCPDNGSAAAPDYTERRRVATVCFLDNLPATPAAILRPC
jgi:type II secretory pathway pseudopilin PulG